MSSPLRVEKTEPAEVAPANAPAPKRRGVKRIVILSVLSILVLVGAVWGFRTFVFYAHHATTDDAQVDGNINPVLPRVPGYVQEVLVRDNQAVHPGDVLVRIDPADLQAKVDQEQASLLNAEAAVAVAEAAVSGARATVVGSQAKVASNQADVTAARTRAEQTAADLARYKQLLSKEEISQQQYDAARAAADSARAAAEAARATTESSRATVQSGGSQIEAATRQVAAAQAQVAQHRATLEAARLQLSYALIKAPVAGIVSKKAVEVGQFVQAGQPLLAIVQGNGETWVSANFKETQLARMHPGQTATIEVDAYPGVTFRGRVESLAAATGARFSLLPPDNATGNFTKVVQRVPVKIVFTDPDPRHPLRVGMNVNATVNLD